MTKFQCSFCQKMAEHSTSNCPSLRCDCCIEFDKVWSNLSSDLEMDPLGTNEQHPIEFLPFHNTDFFSDPQGSSDDLQRSKDGPKGSYVGPQGSSPSKDGPNLSLTKSIDMESLRRTQIKELSLEFDLVVCNTRAWRQNVNKNSKIKSSIRCKIPSFERSLHHDYKTIRLIEKDLPFGIYLESHYQPTLLPNNEIFVTFWADEKSNDLTYADIVKQIRVMVLF